MKLSKKTEYGLLALIEMALQQERGAGARLTTHDIAARQHMPERFLEQQMTTLRNAGLVNSHRGASGGCSLARRPDSITVREVVEALEGTIFEAATDGERDGAGLASGSIHELIGRAQSALAELFGSVTIADLARREQELRERESVMFYV